VGLPPDAAGAALREPLTTAGAVGLYTGFAIVLGVWGVITLVRRIAESEAQQVERRGGRPDTRTSGRADGRTGPPAYPRTDDDAIDYEELRRAEEEVRDLGTDARPEDGFEGDDWGPGAPTKPPYH
jgi:hypothetical protein